MSSGKQKLRLAGAFAALSILALAVGCTGFFQNPVLSSLAIGPASPTIETGSTDNTVQMTVTGTNNDGSTADNPSVAWTITPTSMATVSILGVGNLSEHRHGDRHGDLQSECVCVGDGRP